jgi:LysR family transcriptional regulator, transcriptional activator of the cysJI operon
LQFNTLMKVQSLRMFRDLAEVQNFTQTARLHNVTQSAISQIVQSMERQLHASLVKRKKNEINGFKLTEEGRAFYAFAGQTLQTLDVLRSKIKEIRNTVAANIRIATVQSIGLYDLPIFLRRLMAEWPTLKVHVEYKPRNEVYESLLENRSDLGFVAFPASHPDVSITRFKRDRLVVVCHPRQALAKQKVVKIRALRDMNLVGLKPDAATGRAAENLLSGQSANLKYFALLDDIEAVKRAVEIDLGIAVLPEGIVRTELANRTLAAVPLAGRYLRPLAVIHRKAKVLTPAMKRFIELMREPTLENKGACEIGQQ